MREDLIDPISTKRGPFRGGLLPLQAKLRAFDDHSSSESYSAVHAVLQNILCEQLDSLQSRGGSSQNFAAFNKIQVGLVENVASNVATRPHMRSNIKLHPHVKCLGWNQGFGVSAFSTCSKSSTRKDRVKWARRMRFSKITFMIDRIT